MPRHLISDAHEWINEIPTVPIYYLAKPQPRERAWKKQRGKKTLLSLTLLWTWVIRGHLQRMRPSGSGLCVPESRHSQIAWTSCHALGTAQPMKIGCCTTAKVVGMVKISTARDNGQPSATGAPAPMHAVHRLNGSGSGQWPGLRYSRSPPREESPREEGRVHPCLESPWGTRK
jgi:hypothetical protein